MATPRKYSLEWIGDRAAAAAAIMLFCSTVFGFVWLFARNEVIDSFSKLSGVTDLTEEVRLSSASTAAALDRLAKIVEANAATIKEMHPPKIVDYDEFLSRIFSPCNIGLECEAQIWAKRTEFGVDCSTPTVIGRFVTDKNGIRHSVVPPTKSFITKLDGDSAPRTIIFTVPNRVVDGIAVFYMLLEYDCGVKGVFQQETIHLPFEAIP